MEAAETGHFVEANFEGVGARGDIEGEVDLVGVEEALAGEPFGYPEVGGGGAAEGGVIEGLDDGLVVGVDKMDKDGVAFFGGGEAFPFEGEVEGVTSFDGGDGSATAGIELCVPRCLTGGREEIGDGGVVEVGGAEADALAEVGEEVVVVGGEGLASDVELAEDEGGGAKLVLAEVLELEFDGITASRHIKR